MRLRWLVVLVIGVTLSPLVHAQTPADEQAIRDVMAKAVTDWNRGDLDAFATSYKNSRDTLFLGSTVSRGYAGMLDTYKRIYGTPEKRGTLSYYNLEVHLLDAQYATVIGNCHLERTSAAGGDFDCLYSLVFEKTPTGWKIILDHSTAASRRQS